MSKQFKNVPLLMLIVASLSILTGCNSEDAFSGAKVIGNTPGSTIPPKSGNEDPGDYVNVEYVDLRISPNKNVSINVPTQFIAIATNTEGKEVDVTALVNWQSLGNEFLSFNNGGLAIPKKVGNVEILAVLDNMTSNIVDVTILQSLVCGHILGTHLSTDLGGGINDKDRFNAAGKCIKIIETPKVPSWTDIEKLLPKRWVTSSPSIELLEYLGYQENSTSSNSGDTYSLNQSWIDETNNGVFPEFLFTGEGQANSYYNSVVDFGEKSQYGRWCQKLNDISFAGRTDWKRMTAKDMNTVFRDLLLSDDKNFNGLVEEKMATEYGWKHSPGGVTSDTMVGAVAHADMSGGGPRYRDHGFDINEYPYGGLAYCITSQAIEPYKNIQIEVSDTILTNSLINLDLISDDYTNEHKIKLDNSKWRVTGSVSGVFTVLSKGAFRTNDAEETITIEYNYEGIEYKKEVSAEKTAMPDIIAEDSARLEVPNIGIFSLPLSEEQVRVDTILLDGKSSAFGYEVAKMDWNDADLICREYGMRVPTYTEITALFAEIDNSEFDIPYSFYTTDPRTVYYYAHSEWLEEVSSTEAYSVGTGTFVTEISKNFEGAVRCIL